MMRIIMSCILGAFLFVVCLLVSCDAQIVGFKTTITLSGIEYFKGVGLSILEDQLSSLAIPGITGKASTPVGDVTYTLTNIALTSLTIPDSNVTLVPPTSVNIDTENTKATMTMNWHYREDAFPHISGSGTADITLSETNIAVEMTVSESVGHLVATADSCMVNIGKMDISIHGGDSWFYNWFVGFFTDKIKSITASTLVNQVPQSINQGLATALNSLPITEPINSEVEINYALQYSPNATQTYATLAGRGEFYAIKNPLEAPGTPVGLPDIATQEMVQMFISDFTANSAGFVFFNDGQMKFTITNKMLPPGTPFTLNTSDFIEVVPPLAKAYPNELFVLNTYATSAPTAVFSPQGATVYVNGCIEVIPQPSNDVAFTLGVMVECSGSASLSDMNITAHLTFINATITLVNTNIGDFNVLELQEVVNLLVTEGLIPIGNKILGAGFPLPTISGLSFVNPVVGWGDGYVYVSTNVNYQPSLDVLKNNDGAIHIA